MATKRFLGHAPAVAQVDTLTVGGTVEVGDKFKLTVNGKTLTVSATSTSTSTTAGEIANAWNALNATQYPEFDEVTAAANGSNVTLTADVAGRPFTVTIATTESDDSAADAQTFTKASTTASSGPNHWDTAANWSDGAVPVSTDTVHLEDTAVPILYGLDQNAVTLAALHVWATYAGEIGLPERNQRNYWEYRDTYLKISATVLKIGAGPGAGAGRLKINTGSNASTIDVDRTGATKEPGVPSFCWKGAHASNALSVNRGSVGVAFFALDTATLPTLRVGFVSNRAGDAAVVCGAGATLTTVSQLGGTLQVFSNVTTATVRGGVFTITAAATLGTLDLGVLDPKNPTAATCYYNSSGTLATANVRKGGVLDFSQDMRAKTVTATNVYTGGTVNDPFRAATFTATPAPAGGATPLDIFLNLG